MSVLIPSISIERPIRVAHIVTIYRGVVGILEAKLATLDRHDDLAICCITAPRPDDLELPEPRIRHLCCPMERRIRPLRDLASIRAMAQIFAREGFDIVHSHSAKAGMVAALARRLSPVPFLVHTYHGLPFFEGQTAALNLAYEALENFACHHRDFCFSQNLRDMPAIARMMRSADRVAYEGNGVDIDRVIRQGLEGKKKAAGVFPAGRFRISLVSRLERVKRVDDFLLVMKGLIAEGHDVAAAIAGYGPEQAALAELSRRLGLGEHVRFLGWYHDVPGLLAASDLVLLTSQKEGIPRALIEAMALARPVVATDVLGTQELVVDGRTGHLCPLGDVEALVRRSAALAQDPERRRVFGENGFRRVVEHFDDRKIADRLANFYRSMMAGHRDADLAAGFPAPPMVRAEGPGTVAANSVDHPDSRS